jgi:hypothetical protein
MLIWGPGRLPNRPRHGRQLCSRRVDPSAEQPRPCTAGRTKVSGSGRAGCDGTRPGPCAGECRSTGKRRGRHQLASLARPWPGAPPQRHFRDREAARLILVRRAHLPLPHRKDSVPSNHRYAAYLSITRDRCAASRAATRVGACGQMRRPDKISPTCRCESICPGRKELIPPGQSKISSYDATFCHNH